MNRVPVNPELITWARERAGLEVLDLAGRFPKLADWESGELQPTLRQLESFARAVHVPIGYLFLPEPPAEPLPIDASPSLASHPPGALCASKSAFLPIGPDSRTVAERGVTRPSPNLLDTLYLCQQRQEWFCEGHRYFGKGTGFEDALDWVAKVIEAWPGSPAAQVQVADAGDHPLPDETAAVWFTDPPYYDAVPYADLSDFFHVWLQRTLPEHPQLRDPFDPDNHLTPKKREAAQDETKCDNSRVKDRAWFEEAMGKAFAEGRRTLKEDGVSSVVFAHKTTEGWEALLSGMIRGGWTITGSWPIATEMGSRLRARESAALATSVHLICRPRPEDAPVGDWAEVLGELPRRVGDWMERLQSEGVRGADLVFACIGPALEIFSRYAKVETAECREVPLAEYLEKVWELVSRTALENVLGTAEAKARNGLAAALEEARA